MANKNMKKKEFSKKKIILGVVLVLLLVGVYFGYKGFVLFYSSTRIVSESWNRFESETIEIKKSSGELNLDLDGIFMAIPEVLYENRDVYKDKYLEENVHYFYKDYVDDDNYGAKFVLSLSDLSLEYMLDASSSEVKLMEKNIGSEYGLFNYYREHVDDEISIFTPTDEIILYYMSRNYSDCLMASGKSYILSGDLEGVFTVDEEQGRYIAHLYDVKRGLSFTLSFLNKNEEFFTYDNIIEILESVLFG